MRPHTGWVKYSNKKPQCVMVSLCRGSKKAEFRIHRLVLETFIGPCPNGMEGCHNDGNPLNNHLDNLRWDTHKKNVEDSIKHGTKTPPPIHRGQKHHNTTLKESDILEIRATPIKRGTKAKLARKFNTTQITIARILRRDVWRHI